MGLRRMLARSAVLDDIMHEFEVLSPDVDAAFGDLSNTCELIERERGFDFPNMKSRLQEFLVRRMLRTLTINSDNANWDVIESGESPRFSFQYDNGCLLVERKYKIPNAETPFYKGFTEIDFHGIVDGLPVVGEVKGGEYSTSKRALGSRGIHRKVMAVSDIFHKPAAYVAIIPSDQIKAPSYKKNVFHEQDRFIGRGGQLIAFPFGMREWEEAAYEIAVHYGMNLDPSTLPHRFRRMRTWGNNRRIPERERIIPALQPRIA